ncbi:MAG: T9SS type A sorting domain-containing protein, partial [Flavobacteriales bacterium]
HTMALWHMNDTAGPQVQDASGNAHHLAIINHPHVLKPISNQMMKSNGRSNVSRSQLQSKCAVPTEGYEIYILSGADTTVSNDSTDQDPSIIEREHGDSKPISIGPNPSEDQMHVYGLGKDVKANYKIRNLQGQAVQCGILDRTDRSIYVSSLPTGIYSIQFESIQGNQLLLFSKQ